MPPRRGTGTAFAAVTVIPDAARAPTPSAPPTPLPRSLTLVLRAATGVEAECAGLDGATAAALLRAVLTPAPAGAA